MNKNIIYTFLLVGIALFSACQKEDPEVATPEELNGIVYSESFMSNPIPQENSLVGLVNIEDQTHLCSYNAQGTKNWELNIEAYNISGTSFIEMPFLELKQNKQNEFFVHTYVPNSVRDKNYFVKTVKFNQSGGFVWERTNRVHQPDTLIFGVDTIDIRANQGFSEGKLLTFSGGSLGVLSAMDSSTIDSTFLQLTAYNTDGYSTGSDYMKLSGSWTITQAHVTSEDYVFIIATSSFGDIRLKLIGLRGELLFDINPPQTIIDTYLFYETSQGNIILSASSFEGSDVALGALFCINKNGEVLWSLDSDMQPSWFLHSVKEQADGLLFTGFSSPSALFHWRAEQFPEYINPNADYKAVIVKTDLSGKLLWEEVYGTTVANVNSVGAGIIGNSDFTFFMGKQEGSVKSVAAYKLNENGQIKN